MTGLRTLLFLFSVLFISCKSVQKSTQPLQRIGFGSCLKIENSSEELWNSILSSRPNLFIFAGDNVYADSKDVKVLWEYYQKLERDSGFRRLRAFVPLLAVYDDHDYGLDDGGKENPIRKEAGKACLDFFRVPQDDKRRKHEGIYGSYSYGPEGKRVQVVLLDTRYFRDSLVKVKRELGRYGPNFDTNASLLGQDQWLWLEKTLREPADVRLIVSSIQLIPDKRGFENWGNFPHERQKIFDLIKSTNASGVLFLSGDSHFSEVSCYRNGAYPFYEVTSSALAHHHNTKDGKPTKYSAFPNEYRIKGSDYTAGNFGLISIKWQGTETEVLLELKKTSGETYFSHSVKLKDLQ